MFVSIAADFNDRFLNVRKNMLVIWNTFASFQYKAVNTPDDRIISKPIEGSRENPTRQTLIQSIENSIRSYRYLLLPSTYKRRCKLLREHSVKPTDKPRVVIHSKGNRIDGPQGRRIYTLVVAFVRSGYEVTLVLDLRFVGNLFYKLKRLLLDEPISYAARLEEITEPYLLVCDSPPRIIPDACRKLIEIDYSHWIPDSDSLPLPFPMHPWIYHSRLDEKLGDYRRQTRKVRLFFMGDIAEKYSNHEVEDVYGKLPRDKIVELLEQRLSEGTVRRVRSLEEWREVSETGFHGVVLGSTRDFQVPADEWLKAIASAEAFMVCPGVHYPMCHNAVESLAVGTVPLIEYPRNFHPVLEHDKNCLEFDGEEGLLSSVQKLLSMDASELRAIGDRATQYYNTHLTPQAFTRQIEEWPSEVCRLKVLAHQSEETR